MISCDIKVVGLETFESQACQFCPMLKLVLKEIFIIRNSLVVCLFCQDIVPTRDYRGKYKHLIGSSSGQEAAKITQPNKSFGYGR